MEEKDIGATPPKNQILRPSLRSHHPRRFLRTQITYEKPNYSAFFIISPPETIFPNTT